MAHGERNSGRAVSTTSSAGIGAPQELRQQLKCRGIGPVQILYHPDGRLGRSLSAQPREDRSEGLLPMHSRWQCGQRVAPLGGDPQQRSQKGQRLVTGGMCRDQQILQARELVVA